MYRCKIDIFFFRKYIYLVIWKYGWFGLSSGALWYLPRDMAAPVVIGFPDSDTSDTTLTGSGKFSPTAIPNSRWVREKIR